MRILLYALLPPRYLCYRFITTALWLKHLLGLNKTLVLEFLVLLQGNALPSPHNYDFKSRLTPLPTLPSVLTERALPRHYRGEPVGASGAADEPLFQNEVVAVRDLREGC